MVRILVIDNYDSFTFNLVQYLGVLGAEVRVERNDRISLDDALATGADRIVISPGPGGPLEAGISNDLILAAAGRIPVFGVCLGQQCLAHAFGGRVVHAPEVRHGKTSTVHNDGFGVFHRLPRYFTAARYHSLIVDRATLPDCFEVSAFTDDGLVMGLRHKTHALEGVQFHPESFMTTHGLDLMRNVVEGRIGRSAP
ncbi:MAG: aminodeoxychorismate/anthranilate synthase component II [Deltaproteobacteria bacterium]|nr:aminodeoxychorismate/anthranilate synthase component II [Deltaproteobacteria bacterium]